MFKFLYSGFRDKQLLSDYFDILVYILVERKTKRLLYLKSFSIYSVKMFIKLWYQAFSKTPLGITNPVGKVKKK